MHNTQCICTRAPKAYTTIYTYIYIMDEYQVPRPGAPAHPRDIRVTPVLPSPGGPGRASDEPETAQGRSKTAQEAPETAPERSKTVQEGPESPKDRSKTPKMASRRPKRPPRRSKRPPRRLPRGPREAKNIDFHYGFDVFFAFLPCPLPDAPTRNPGVRGYLSPSRFYGTASHSLGFALHSGSGGMLVDVRAWLSLLTSDFPQSCNALP